MYEGDDCHLDNHNPKQEFKENKIIVEINGT